MSHLERVAAHMNPEAQRYEAACVKLLASALMNLDGDDAADDDSAENLSEDSPLPGRCRYPAAVPECMDGTDACCVHFISGMCTNVF